MLKETRWLNRCNPHLILKLISCRKKCWDMFILNGSLWRPFLEAWYPRLIMSAAIVCVFMNSSFSSVPRRFTYAILHSTLVDSTIYTPQNKHGTWKWALGKGDSYWKPSFPGSMLIFGGVIQYIHALEIYAVPCCSYLCFKPISSSVVYCSTLRVGFAAAFSCPLEEDSGKPFIARSTWITSPLTSLHLRIGGILNPTENGLHFLHRLLVHKGVLP